MKKLLLSILASILILSANAQIIKRESDSVRLDAIEQTLKSYGRQNVISDKVTMVSIGLVIGGAIFKVKSTPLLVTTSICSLANLIISYKADRRLSRHKSVTNQ
jgi:hypothetical protein